MKGHDALIAMRRRGTTPAVVFLDTEPCFVRAWADWQQHTPAAASVWVEPGESMQRIDLRCVVGLPVVVTGMNAERVRAVADAAAKAKAKAVTGYVYRYLTGRQECETVEMFQWEVEWQRS